MNDKIKVAVRLVEGRHKVSYDDILSKSRKARFVKARRELCFILRTYLHLSYPQIGEIINRDHTTIIHAVREFSKDNILPFTDSEAISLDNLSKFNGDHFYTSQVSVGGRWSRLIRARGAKCEIPGCGFDDILEVHHLISKKIGGTDDEYNVIVLCPNHHSMIHQGILKIKREAFPLLNLPPSLCTDYGGKLEEDG